LSRAPRGDIIRLMGVYKIVIPQAEYFDLGLGRTSFSNQQEGVDAVDKACKEKVVKYSRTVEEDSVIFRNEHGGVIARVVPAS
jgi:hypothetical protein